MQEQVNSDKKSKEAKTKKQAIDWREVITHVAVKAAEGFVTGVALGVAGLAVSSLTRSINGTQSDNEAVTSVKLKSVSAS